MDLETVNLDTFKNMMFSHCVEGLATSYNLDNQGHTKRYAPKVTLHLHLLLSNHLYKIDTLLTCTICLLLH